MLRQTQRLTKKVPTPTRFNKDLSRTAAMVLCTAQNEMLSQGNAFMRWNQSCLIGLIFLFSFTNSMEAQSLFEMIKGYPVPNCVPNRTCDDYCKKPQPCAPAPCTSTCDDYCKRPQPCVQGVTQFRCDDYCCKPVPVVCQCCPAGYCQNQPPEASPYLRSQKSVWDDLSATTYQDPLGNIHFLRNPLLESHWAQLSITRPFANRQPAIVPNREYLR